MRKASQQWKIKWMRETKRGSALAMNAGRGTDSYTESWRSCLCGVKCKTFKPCLWEKLRLKTDMLILKAFWLTDVFFEQDSKKNPDHVGSQDLFKLQLEYESYPAEHINHINHMCLSHIFWIMIWILKWPQTGEIIWFYKWGKLSRDKTSLKILLITQLVILNGWHYILYISIYYSQPSSNF